MNHLGSLLEFIPSVSQTEEKPLPSHTKKEPAYLISNPSKKSANSLGLKLSSSICKFHSGTSTGGYCFSSRIKAAQERINLQSKQNPRSLSFIKSRKKSAQTSGKLYDSSLQSDRIKPTEDPSQSKNLFEDHLRHELQMKNHHFLIRTMKKQKVSEDVASKVYDQKSKNHLFNEFAKSLMQSSDSASPEKNLEKSLTYRHVKLEDAQERLHQESITNWLLHLKKAQKKSHSFYHFVIEFFESLDTNKSGRLKGEKLLESLLYLGIGTDPSVIRRTLCLIYKCKDLTSLQLNCKEFAELFKTDAKTDKILAKINEHCIQARENKKKTFFKLDTASSIFKKTHKRSSKNSYSSTGVRFFYKESTENNEVVTINEHIELITGWWKEIDKTNLTQVAVEEIVEFFIGLNLGKDRNEAKILIQGQIGQRTSASFDEFQQIFAKSMLKGALLNLSKRLLNESYSNLNVSAGCKLLNYQRALLMSGVRCPNSDITEDEGAKTINAIEKLNGQTNKHEKASFEEIKKNLLRNLGISELEYLRTRGKLKNTKMLSETILASIKQQITKEKPTEANESMLKAALSPKESKLKHRKCVNSRKSPQRMPSPERKSIVVLSERDDSPIKIEENQVVFAQEDKIEMPYTSNIKFYKSFVKPQKSSVDTSQILSPERVDSLASPSDIMENNNPEGIIKINFLSSLLTEKIIEEPEKKHEDLAVFIPSKSIDNKNYIKRAKQIQKSKRRCEAENSMFLRFQKLINYIPKT